MSECNFETYRFFDALIFLVFVQLIKTHRLNLSCTFVDVDTFNDTQKECSVNNFVVTSRNHSVTSVNDQEGNFRHYEDVKVLSFHHQTVYFMPKGIAKIFPRLEVILITNSKLKEIERSDLENFEKLQELYLYGNDLEKLDSDLFESNPSIKIINFGYNRLKFVGKNIFKPLTKLEYADFEGNDCINRVAGNGSEVEELINEPEYECSSSSKGIITSQLCPFLITNFVAFLMIFKLS